MRKAQDPIDRIRIATPCPATWEGMAGNERVRHCALCDLNVYNFAEMTRDEVRELLARAEGRVCGRLDRRADGTLLTKTVRGRMSRWASAMVAAALSVVTFASGCTSAGKSRLAKHRSKMELEVERVAAPQAAVFAGVVLEQSSRTSLPGVTVVLRNEATEREITLVTDRDGAFQSGALTEGLYRVEVTLGGFKSALVEHVPLKQSEITRAHVELRLDTVTTVIVGAIDVDPANDALSTTFTKEFIDNLPH